MDAGVGRSSLVGAARLHFYVRNYVREQYNILGCTFQETGFWSPKWVFSLLVHISHFYLLCYSSHEVIIMNRRNNEMIEATRYICCVVVLCIHCALPQPIGEYFNRYGRFAVPFFLLVSGFYFYGGNSTVKSLKKIKQTAIIILINAPICLTWNCVNSYIGTGSFINWIHNYPVLHTCRDLLLFNRAVFINSSFYYLFMLLYVYVFCFLIVIIPHTSRKIVRTTAFLLLIIGYCIHHFTNHAWYHVGNFLFTGIPLFFVGHFLHENSIILRTLNKFSFPLVILSAFFTYTETHFLGGTYLTIGQVLFAIIVLSLCIHNEEKTSGILAYLGSNTSMIIFIYHCQIRDTVLMFINKRTLLYPISVILLSTSLGVIVSSLLNMTEKKSCRWIK